MRLLTEWIDISTPLVEGMEVYPGDPPVEIRLSRLAMHPHTGTHIDAPLHFIPGGASVEAMPFSAMMGPCIVCKLTELVRGERILLKNARSGIGREAARRLVSKHVRVVGVDSLSVGDGDVHKILLGAGIWIIEGLRLAHVPAGRYELICLPLLIPGADGAPARAALRAL